MSRRSWRTPSDKATSHSIHTSTAYDAESSEGEEGALAVSASEDDVSAASDSSEDVEPMRKRVKVANRPGQTQARIGGTAGQLATRRGNAGSRRLAAGAPRATLVIAPMTLLSQWCDELQRSSKDGMSVLMYYGSNRTNVQDEIDDGVQVVVTRCASVPESNLLTAALMSASLLTAMARSSLISRIAVSIRPKLPRRKWRTRNRS